MLNFGFWASSKGMVKVPDLSGLTKSAAITAIQNANLNYVDGGSTTTNNSSLDNIVASQLPNANELVQYESNVTFIYYTYVAVPTPTPVTPTPVTPTPVTPTPVTPTPVTPVTPTTYDIYVYCDALTGIYSGYYGTQSSSSYITVGTTTDPSLTSEQIIAICGVPNDCVVAPTPTPIPTPVTPTPVTPTPVTPTPTYCRTETRSTSRALCDSELAEYYVCYANPDYTNEISATFVNCLIAPSPTPTPVTPTPVTPTPVTPTPYFKGSLSPSTKVIMSDGILKDAVDVVVGDELKSVIIPGLGDNFTTTEVEQWIGTSSLSALEPTATTVTSITVYTSPIYVNINGDGFSGSHLLLTKRNNEVKMRYTVDILDTDLVWGSESNSWESITSFEKIVYDNTVISINCEPYDMFFTEKALTHDGNQDSFI